MRRSNLQICVLALLLILLNALAAPAKDVFLTIGGGYSPQGNQVSLEKNVLFFQRLLAQERPDGAPHDIYFADGHNPQRDLQFSNADGVPEANWLMAEFFGEEDHIDLEYRNHEVPGLRGGSSKENVDAWLDEVGPTLVAGDRVIFYVTAHGGRSRDKDRPFNTRLYFWGNESLPAVELAESIERLPEGVQVVLVMVQCYSGGFASIIFNGADEDRGLVDRDCCGFFATVHDRVAAGCTPDIDEENYREYSSYFWAGIGGRTRTGEEIRRPDYNGDGEVSFSEAHSYVLLTSDTIDIPTKTSGAFLRTYSRLRSRKAAELLSANTRYEYLRNLANPAEAAVLDGLSAQLQLTGERRADAADDLADEIEKKRKELTRDISRKERRQKRIKREISDDLQQRWPELDNILSATATALLTSRADEFLEAVHSHDRYSEFANLANEITALETERFELERKWVKCRRLERILENVALARNLACVAPAEIVRRFERMVAAEESTLHASRTPPPLPPDVPE